ncbi:MAG: single-stranded DNA-binding protein [Proteobacteria bacterium]|nr:single-stranded DNA-binding protein [Pseudomonadota bacterium]
MAYSLNRVDIIGNCGKDPEVRSLNSGDKVANLRIATTERWNDKNSNQQKEQTEWHSIVVFGKMAEIVEKYVRKGSKLYCSGKLCTRKWEDNNGNDKYTTEVQVNSFNGNIILLDSKGGSQQQSSNSISNNSGGYQKPQHNQGQNSTGFQTDFSSPF